MPYCCITTQIAKGKTFMIDYETVKVMNYHSTHLPGGTYSFSLDSSAFRNPNYQGIYKFFHCCFQ